MKCTRRGQSAVMLMEKLVLVAFCSLCIQTKLQEQLADQAYTLEKEKEKQKEEIRKVNEAMI